MYFNLKKTAQYKAIKWSRNPLLRLNRFLRIWFFIAAIVLLALVFGAIWKGGLSAEHWERLFGGGLLCLSIAIALQELNVFFRSSFKKPRLTHTLSELVEKPAGFNLASFLDYNSTRICLKAFRIAKKRSLAEPNPAGLAMAMASLAPREIRFIFARADINLLDLKDAVKTELSYQTKKASGDTVFSEIIFSAAKIANERKRERISAGDILLALADKSLLFQTFLTNQDFRKQDIENLFFWYEKRQDKRKELRRFWDYNNLLRKGSIARDFTAGYSLTLDSYSRDLGDSFKKGGFREIVGHKNEIKQIERVLEKSQINNVLLVGEPGTGRRSIIEAVAQKAFLGTSVSNVNYKRFLEFDLTALVAGISNQEEVEAALEECFSEVVKAGNIILVINDFENFVERQARPGTVNITGILSRYLNSRNFQIIAVASYSGLHRTIEKNPSLLNLFEKVEAEEISERQTLLFLQNQIPLFEAKSRRYITYKALREIVELSSRFLGEIPFPDRAVRLLDEAVAYLVTYTKSSVLLPEHIQKIVSEKAQVPIGQAKGQEKEMLLNLESLIHERLINQELAVRELSASLRRARAEVSVKSGPIGSFLFLGSTGVGKTEAAKALTAIYYGNEDRMIRMDMSEFQNTQDIQRFIGDENTPGMLTTAVREDPFSLILLDELEKAHPNILTLFLQVLDEGWLTDGLGRKVDFKNTIIIATSNAGAEFIRQSVKQGRDLASMKDELVDYLLKSGIYRPEFINRFDSVVIFKPLSKENLLAISQLQLKKLKDNLKDKGIQFEITAELKQKIVELSYKPEFGAREMKRVIQDKVENVLARAILTGELKRGSQVIINAADFTLQISPIR